MTWSWLSFAAGAAALLAIEGLIFWWYVIRTADRNGVDL